MRYAWRCATAMACAGLLAGVVGTRPAGAGDEMEKPRIGVFFFSEAPEYEEAFAGIRDGFRLARMEPETLERTAGGDEADARAALLELSLEGVHLVFAIGDEAAARARDAVRDRPVVFTAVSDAEAAGLADASNVCGTCNGVPGDRVLGTVLWTVPSLRHLGLVVPQGNAAASAAAKSVTEAVRVRAEDGRTPVGTTVVSPGGATPEERAEAVVEALLPEAGAVWLPPAVSQDDTEALAAALAGRGVPLLGSSRAQLDAGCVAVIHADARELGALAVVQARRVLAGADPASIPVRRPSRFLVEVNLNAARRLDFEPPLTLLAGADHVTPAFGGVRR